MQLDQVILRARSGDRTAFEALVERFEGPLLSFLRLSAPTDHDAEELAQETFLKVWQNLGTYDPRGAFSTWLFTLGKHLAISRLRRPHLRPATDDELGTAAGGIDPARIASRRDEHENVWRVARQVLSHDALSALWLRYAEDLSLGDIARVLDKREATVRVILCRARARLVRQLEEPSVPEARPNVAACSPPTLDAGGIAQ